MNRGSDEAMEERIQEKELPLSNRGGLAEGVMGTALRYLEEVLGSGLEVVVNGPEEEEKVVVEENAWVVEGRRQVAVVGAENVQVVVENGLAVAARKLVGEVVSGLVVVESVLAEAGSGQAVEESGLVEVGSERVEVGSGREEVVVVRIRAAAEVVVENGLEPVSFWVMALVSPSREGALEKATLALASE